ncbi:hypothetical protein UFOVP326_31 [uncultured Caudovirales phage]|uniref:Uncharacterized protein n=1 Tax=uncultured Caudovirales phage TaxID=2100421 RepID=A0A6J5LS91_9CAUD|nr:hypothetical protein UFOVP326_31 [uncultured Caudovirales phage]
MDAMTAAPSPAAAADELGGFLIRNLSNPFYAQGFTWWHYKPQNTIREVVAPNFFGGAADRMVPGDLIVASCADGKVEFLVTAAEEPDVVEAAITSSFIVQPLRAAPQ